MRTLKHFLAAAATFAQTGGDTGLLHCEYHPADLMLTITESGAMPDYTYGNTPWHPFCSSVKFINIENRVTTIGNHAFWTVSLTKVIIPNSVTSVGEYAFNYCTFLTAVAITESITTIGNSAFQDCRSLTTAAISNSVTSIEGKAFAGCFSLTDVIILDSVIFIRCYAFGYGISLTTLTRSAETPQAITNKMFEDVNLAVCTLYVPAKSIELYHNADVWKDFGNIEAITVTLTGVSLNKAKLLLKVGENDTLMVAVLSDSCQQNGNIQQHRKFCCYVKQCNRSITAF